MFFVSPPGLEIFYCTWPAPRSNKQGQPVSFVPHTSFLRKALQEIMLGFYVVTLDSMKDTAFLFIVGNFQMVLSSVERRHPYQLGEWLTRSFKLINRSRRTMLTIVWRNQKHSKSLAICTKLPAKHMTNYHAHSSWCYHTF